MGGFNRGAAGVNCIEQPGERCRQPGRGGSPVLHADARGVPRLCLSCELDGGPTGTASQDVELLGTATDLQFKQARMNRAGVMEVEVK
jgi:hypothetical protein